MTGLLGMIETVNAADNDHTISINEQLSFQVAHPWWQMYKLPLRPPFDAAAC